MESAGDEKRIRALFSEQRFVNEQTAPGFTAVWHRAQARSLKPRRAFNFSFVTATVLLVLALGSLAIWTRYSQTATPARAEAVIAGYNLRTSLISKGTNVGAPAGPTTGNLSPPKSRRTRLAAPRQDLTIANSRVVKEVKALESWQSPTVSLLSSPSDDLFKSLPQLNENASELKSFLPNRANDKEK